MGDSRHRLTLLGSFGLFAGDGRRVPVTSRRSAALIAMVALSRAGERDRKWLHAQLWGSRGAEQAQASLRRELANLRVALGPGSAQILLTDNRRVRLDLNAVEIDVRTLERAVGEGTAEAPLAESELLEGLDIPGEEAFEDWLRLQRTLVADLVESARGQGWEGRMTRRLHVVAGPGDAANPQAIAGRPFSIRPSLAVARLPAGGSDLDEAIAEGVFEELTLTLSNYSTLLVVGAGALSREEVSAGDRTALCRRLDVRYLLEGSVRRYGDRLRVSVHLVDGAVGEQLWAERHDGTLADLVALQEGVAARVAPLVDASIEQGERRRAAGRVVPEEGAYALFWRANALFRQFRPEPMREAIAICERLEALEPQDAWPAALAAFCCATSVNFGWGSDLAGLRAAAGRHYARAMALGGDDPFVLGYAAGTIMGLAGDLEVADRLVARALELQPFAAHALFWGGWVDVARGAPARALERFGQALRLNPRSGVRPHTLTGLGIAHLFAGRPHDALPVLAEAVQHMPDAAVTLAALALALAGSGRTGEAAACGARLAALGGLPAVSGVIKDKYQLAALASLLPPDLPARRGSGQAPCLDGRVRQRRSRVRSEEALPDAAPAAGA